MAKVRAFGLNGLELWFNTNDHLEPHFHVSPTSDDWEFRVFFLEAETLMFEAKRPKNAKLSGRIRRQLAQNSSANRQELLDQWNEVVPEEHKYPRKGR